MDEERALKIVQKDGLELENLPAHFKKDRKIVLEAVKQDGLVLEYVIDDSFKKDKEIVLAAVKQSGLVLKYADYSLRKDPDIQAIINKKK